MKRKVWTEREDEELVKQIEQRGLPPRKVKIYDDSGRKRTRGSVKDEIAKLRTQGRITKTFVQRSPAEQLTLAELRIIRTHSVEAKPGQRLGPAGLSRLPELSHRTRSELGAIKHRYDLTDRNLSQQAQQAFTNRLAASRERQVLKFLRTDGKYLTAALAAAECDTKPGVIILLRRKYKLPKYTHQEAMRDPKYRRWYKAQIERRADTLKEKFQRKANVKRHFLEQEKQRLSRNEMQRCSVCGNKYPKTPSCFRQYKGKSRGGQTRYSLSSVCIACPVKGQKKTEFRAKKYA